MVSLAAQEWKAEGQAEGRLEGTADSIVMILEARFGPADPQVRDRLTTLTVEQLRPLVTRAATINSLDTLFEGGGSS